MKSARRKSFSSGYFLRLRGAFGGYRRRLGRWTVFTRLFSLCCHSFSFSYLAFAFSSTITYRRSVYDEIRYDTMHCFSGEEDTVVSIDLKNELGRGRGGRRSRRMHGGERKGEIERLDRTEICIEE